MKKHKRKKEFKQQVANEIKRLSKPFGETDELESSTGNGMLLTLLRNEYKRSVAKANKKGGCQGGCKGNHPAKWCKFHKFGGRMWTRFLELSEQRWWKSGIT